MTQRIILRMLHSLMFVLILVTAQTAIAQDKIYTKNDKVIECRITKIDAENIEYLDGQEVFGKIKKVNVRQVEFSKTPREPIDYSDNTTKAIKFNFLALRTNALQLSYEKALDAVSSFEITAKVYGLSIRKFEKRKIGGGIDLGYRFRMGSLLRPEKRGNIAHVLDGVGLKPVIGFSYAEVENEGASEEYYYAHLGSVLNYQVAFKNKILFEVYAGLHVFKGDSELLFPNTPPLNGVLDFEDGDLNGSDNVAYSLGLKFGYLFGEFGRTSKLLRW